MGGGRFNIFVSIHSEFYEDHWRLVWFRLAWLAWLVLLPESDIPFHLGFAVATHHTENTPRICRVGSNFSTCDLPGVTLPPILPKKAGLKDRKNKMARWWQLNYCLEFSPRNLGKVSI